jgi:hypothetical protein
MTMLKVAVTVPDVVLRDAKLAVRAHRAKTLSAYVSEALVEKLSRDNLEAVLDAMDATLGPPSKQAKARAKRALSK